MKNLEFLKNNLIAHRGYHDIKKGIPENSIVAFKRAIRYNYTIELDVHLTKDNKLVVFHDDNLKRVCGVDKNINLCTYDELLKYNLFDTNYKIPLFKEVLSVVNGKVPLLIETKYYPKYGVLEKKLVEELKDYNGKYAIQSFFIKSLYWIMKNTSSIPLGLLSSDFKRSNNTLKSLIGKTLIYDILLKTDFISFDIRALPNKFIESKRKNKLILGWTIRNKNDYEKVKEYCDNFICENIESFKS